MVARLEEFPASQIEHSNSGPVMQYRGQIMPLIDIAEQMGIRGERDANQNLQVVVYVEGGRSVGLLVDQIVDVAEQSAVVEGAGDDGGLVGSAVLQDRVTDLLDVSALMKHSAPREMRW
jgi:two-component system chemotaxis sensor kinase CheA